jgi:hypothetical protein
MKGIPYHECLREQAADAALVERLLREEGNFGKLLPLEKLVGSSSGASLYRGLD